ncbi:hypothetical protein H9564_05710 [Limosilactobacillus sp. Sa3CUN2]|uniref:Membrane protein 6-pyruvoyl-tetrahydropterin synthase-related domain-containing protein n=1 Tax=Limosilactobacillus avistercoris TaxID=2762243 RepID=A0ABR8PD90_9LACO|nr:hypothetical protein [Limosilactobacillus avistercoris]MBD7895201.1 hypothetical protein [Limosilactobacillus avistercoris]
MLREENMGKTRQIRIGTLLIVLMMFYIYSAECQFNGGVKLFGDGIFHVQRILEIRNAFLHLQMPSWVNFSTFFEIGQAVNGMYPDITLWPLVLITIFLSPQHQVVAISFLIFFLTLIVTWLCLSIRTNNIEMSFYLATIYTFSGYTLYQFLNEIQPSAAIINIFVFPIFFVSKELLGSKKIDITLICKFSLCIILIGFSHLLSLIVYGFLLGSVVLFRIFQKKISISFFVNAFLSFPLVLVGMSPIIYRVLKISSSGILEPFGKGHIKAATLPKMLNFISWWSREQLSIAALVLLIVVYCFFNSNMKSKLIRLSILEGYMFILCLKIFPWKAFNHVPLINNLQYTPWRFGIWLSVIPIIMFADNFKDYQQFIGIKISHILALLSVILSISAQSYLISGQVLRLNNDVIAQIMATTPIASEQKKTIMAMGEHPDYFPKVENVKNRKYELLPSRLDQIWNQKIKVENKSYDFVEKIGEQNLSFYVKNIKRQKGVNIELPILGYRSLDYHIALNNKKVQYKVNKQGNMVINNADIKMNSMKIDIRFIMPRVYKILLIISFISILFMLIPVIRSYRRE